MPTCATGHLWPFDMRPKTKPDTEAVIPTECLRWRVDHFLGTAPLCRVAGLSLLQRILAGVSVGLRRGPAVRRRGNPCQLAECAGEMLRVLVARGHRDIDNPRCGIDKQVTREIEACLPDEIGIGVAAQLEAALQRSAGQTYDLGHEAKIGIAVSEVGSDRRPKEICAEVGDA